MNVVGEVADIRSYQLEGEFDIVLIDRTLHTLNEKNRLNILRSLVCHVAESGHLLVAHEHSNIAGFHQVLEASESNWNVTKQCTGFFICNKNQLNFHFERLSYN